VNGKRGSRRACPGCSGAGLQRNKKRKDSEPKTKKGQTANNPERTKHMMALAEYAILTDAREREKKLVGSGGVH